MATTEARAPVRLGLMANFGQFALLVGINALVGALVGQERTLVPLLGERVFGLTSSTAALAFLISFGLAKAAANLAAGWLAERIGRKRTLVLGWAIGLPVPLALMWAPSWAWVVAINALLGVNQGLTWSTTVVMKIDLAGPHRRGLAMGLNEFAGYFALAASAGASGYLASTYGLRPEPFFFGLAVAGLGLAASALFVRDTMGHARLEACDDCKPLREVAALVSYRHAGLAAVSRTGLVNNANDAYVWGLLPLLLAREGLSAAEIGFVAALYPGVWSLGQLLTGPFSDRVGRRLPASSGMLLQAVALTWFIGGHGLGARAGAAALLGVGTALTYPSLLAAVGDLADASWRASAVGVYRTWRDLGYVFGALASGAVADMFGLDAALGMIAAATALSALDSWRNMPSTPSSSRLNNLESDYGRPGR
jgi:MFS family permease